MAWRLERPDLDPGGDQFEFSRDGELCAVGSHHFILANIELPYRGSQLFVWACWISLSDGGFQRIDERWAAQDRENDEPAFGWLSSILPTYVPTTWALKARVHQRPVGERPWVELEPTDHPLSIRATQRRRRRTNRRRLPCVFPFSRGIKEPVRRVLSMAT